MHDVAIAFMIFNRPEETRRSFASIRSARPSRLFLVGDAPRPEFPSEARLVQQVREIAEQVDWPCEVRKIYAEENLGCGRRISSGITQAFQEVEQLIVLEDDCVADPSFFGFCSELLDRYQADQRVTSISGTSFQQDIPRGDASYYFSKYAHCWGWATWKRAWQHFQLDMPGWPEFRDAGHLQSICRNPGEIAFWMKTFDRSYRGAVDSWAIPWAFCCWAQHGLNAIPATNLVSNIGFGDEATHTRDDRRNVASMPTRTLQVTKHPEFVVPDLRADALTDDRVFTQSRRRQGLLRRITRSLPRLKRAA